MCVFLVPIYCTRFAFSSLFIGSNGVYINEIKAKCDGQIQISVNVQHDTMSVLVMGSDSPLDFIRGIRLCQDRLVIVYEIFLKERSNRQNCCKKRCSDDNPKMVFVQPFYPQKARDALNAFYSLERSNLLCLGSDLI